MRRGDDIKVNRGKLLLPTRVLNKIQDKLLIRELLPFCRSLLLWGHISQRKFPGQTGPSARGTDIKLEPENVSHRPLNSQCERGGKKNQTNTTGISLNSKKGSSNRGPQPLGGTAGGLPINV